MGSLLHPVGSQPAAVYWLRRTVVVLIVAAVLVGIGWLLFRPPDQAAVIAVPNPTTATGSPSPNQTSASPTPTPTGPVVCGQGNSALSLVGYQKVTADATQVFKLSINNASGQDCVLDLKPAAFELSITSGKDQIWSTADCAKWVPAKKTTLKPAQSHEFSIEWSLKRSAAGCKLAKAEMKPGTYVAEAVFADSVKARQVFNITK